MQKMKIYPYNLHSHTNFSDGSSPPEDYIKSAINAGIEVYGFSDHAPIPGLTNEWCMQESKIAKYFYKLRKLKEKNKNRIKVLIGLEVDYIPGIIKPADFGFYHPDYLIGSIHYLRHPKTGCLIETDSGLESFLAGMNKHFKGDLEYTIKYYYQQIIQLLSIRGFEILAHVDKIRVWIEKMQPEILTSNWYRQLLRYVAEEAYNNSIYVEINTRGMYKGTTLEPFPSWDFIRILDENHVQMILNADTHHPNDVISKYEETLLELEKLKIKNLVNYQQM
jgi:histidinol-phosphatase (PHP family)